MEVARQKDSLERDWPLAVRSTCVSMTPYTDSPSSYVRRNGSFLQTYDEGAPTMIINFVLLRSPLLSPHNPETIVMSWLVFDINLDHTSEELSAGPPLAEILWNFSRYKDRARITLEQNPHFYLRCPANEGAYTPTFRRHPLQESSGALEHNDTVYILFDRQSRVFLDTEHKSGSLETSDSSGVLVEQLVRGSSIRLTPTPHANVCIGPTSTASNVRETSTACYTRLSIHSAVIYSSTCSINIDGWTAGISGISDLCGASSPMSVGDGVSSYESAFHLGMHVRCTYGTPIVDTLNHLPPIPLFVDYQQAVKRGWGRMTTTGEDESGIYHALRLRDRVCSIDLCLPPSILHAALMLMDEPFPILEHLSLSSTDDKITKLALSKTFLAPKLYHLALVGIGLPKRLRLLSSTVSLVTLKLTNIRASGYFHPRLLVARLRSIHKLEALTIKFSVPIPRPSAKRELLAKQGTPVTLHNLKNLTFQGISTYLECLVAQIRAPLLERLDIALFNQIAFSLPHLSHLTNIAEGLKISTARVSFERDAVTIVLGYYYETTCDDGTCFTMQVMCKQLDWQIDCAAQICSSLMPMLSGVEGLTLNFHELVMPTEWQNGEIDGTTWHELLRSFTEVETLHISESLSQELSRALEADEIGSDPGLLPNLKKIVVNQFTRNYADSLFGLFIHARQVAGRPVLSTPFQLPFGA
ncbi:hypothetical protein EDB85DRAFT_1890065 [Lactarius pseudohatsudake]|nr:hypothetical protein EDB85DRAFT_1890065 [Lactarius pseudohatsudake]